MPPEPTPKVFISYAWNNQSVAKQLQRDLMRAGVEVFVDYEKISGGDSLPARISAGLEWCNTLVLLWSTDAAESYYVSQEWTSAFHLQKRIIACVLDGTKLPALLSGNLYLNFSPYETGYVQLCRSLGVEPKAGSSAAPLPQPDSKLPPQHVDLRGNVQQPSPTQQSENPPASTTKSKTVLNALASRLKGKKPQADETILVPTQEPISESKTLIRWPRGKATNIALVLIVAAAILIGERLLCQKNTLSLRKESMVLSEDGARKMLVEQKLFDSVWNKDGKGITHQYKTITHASAQFVFDGATSLTWQWSGSENSMTYVRAKAYVDSLRQINYGGYSDWRLPTLEEAMSLMEREKKNRNLYIAPVFDHQQFSIWTADFESASVTWVAVFHHGSCGRLDVGYAVSVRAVRSGQ